MYKNPTKKLSELHENWTSYSFNTNVLISEKIWVTQFQMDPGEGPEENLETPSKSLT